jgi:hypothetical protein
MLRKVLPSRRKGSFRLQEEPRGRTLRRRYQGDQFHGAILYHHREQWRGSPEAATESGPFNRCLLRFSVGQWFRLRTEHNRKADIHIDNIDNIDDERPYHARQQERVSF